jgi:hypothetical protein
VSMATNAGRPVAMNAEDRGLRETLRYIWHARDSPDMQLEFRSYGTVRCPPIQRVDA